MADSAAFAFACGELERVTKWTREQARGTVRIALREAGFSANAVRAREMQVVFERLMPKELALRRVADGDKLCAEIGLRVGQMNEDASGETPEAVFGRLGGR
jgi:hypothetical protein